MGASSFRSAAPSPIHCVSPKCMDNSHFKSCQSGCTSNNAYHSPSFYSILQNGCLKNLSCFLSPCHNDIMSFNSNNRQHHPNDEIIVFPNSTRLHHIEELTSERIPTTASSASITCCQSLPYEATNLLIDRTSYDTQWEELLNRTKDEHTHLLTEALKLEHHNNIQESIHKYIEFLSWKNLNNFSHNEVITESHPCIQCTFFDSFLTQSINPQTSGESSYPMHPRRCILHNIIESKQDWNLSIDVHVLDRLGQLFFETGFFFEAKQCYLKALQLNPLCGTILYHLGILQQATHDLLGALHSFQTAIQHDKGLLTPSIYIPALFSLGILYRDLNQFHYAKSCFQKIIQLESRNVAACVLLSDCFEKLGEIVSALKYLKIALQLNPTDYSVKRSLQRLQLLLNQSEISNQ